MATHEYKVATFTMGWKGYDYTALESELNELGRQGWAAVSTLAPSIGSGHTHEFAVILTRPRS